MSKNKEYKKFELKEYINKDNEELQNIFKRVKNVVLSDGENNVCEAKDVKEFYLKVLEYLINNKPIITNGKNFIATENSGNLLPIGETGKYAKTGYNNGWKFYYMFQCFKDLEEKEIDRYTIIVNSKDTAEKNEEEQEVNNNNQNMSEKIEEIVAEDILKNKQVIFTGAPGTGKTWAVKSFVEKKQKGETDTYKFVQFHSSYDYTDFVEGLRPVPDKDGGNIFVRMDGIFKSFCRKIVKENLEKLSEKKGKIMSIEEYFRDMQNSDYRKEVYKKLSENPYYFIIDEINRADLSRVFGELMYGLEESYREIHNRFDTQYKNLPTHEMKGEKADIIADDCFKYGFFVPYNLHIIGTMNDIDRSVESFDFALRRRFIWIDIKANDIMCESLKSMCEKEGTKSPSEDNINEISEKICQMNNIITESGYGFSEAYHIGPAYFKDLVKVSDEEVEVVLRNIFKNRIEPILREYMRGRKAEAQDELIKVCRVELLGELDEKN